MQKKYKILTQNPHWSVEKAKSGIVNIPRAQIILTTSNTKQMPELSNKGNMTDYAISQLHE